MKKNSLAVNELPESYKELFSVKLTNKKQVLIVNAIAILIGVVMAVPMHFLVPFQTLFSMENGIVPYMIRFLTLMVSIVAYIVMHEAVHAIVMKHYGAEKCNFGFNGLYAWAGADCFFPKKPYIVIALAPVVFWGIVLVICNLIVPYEWFWVVYVIQICNVSGAGGDFYVSWKFSKMSSDILIKDTGHSMTVYGK